MLRKREGGPEAREGFIRREKGDLVHPRALKSGGNTGMVRKIRSDLAGGRIPWWITEAKLIAFCVKSKNRLRVTQLYQSAKTTQNVVVSDIRR